MNIQLRLYLIELAWIRRKVGYAKVMAQFGLDVSKPSEVDYFADEIGEISEFEHGEGRPMLSSLIVHSSMTSIGYGFYGLAEKLGYGKKEDLHKTHFERKMQTLCYDFWADDDVYYQHTGKKRPPVELTNYSLYPNDLPQDGYERLPDRIFDFEGYETDWVQKHLDNMECGNLGEDLVLEYEKRVLSDNGFPELISLVTKVKDGNGYDIFSVDFFGNPKYIEVKTTLLDERTPFSISINEIRFSEIHANNYYLYRLYNLDMNKRTADFYEYAGNLNDHFFLDGVQFEAFPKKKF